MGWIGQVWQLRRGDELLGEVTIEGADFLWLHGIFAPQPGFAQVAPLFADELVKLESLMDGDGAKAVAAPAG